MSHAALLLVALLLDAALGEPRAVWDRIPHPAVLMGRAVRWLDKKLNNAPHARLRGVVAAVVLAGGAVAVGFLIAALPLGGLWEALVAAVLLAQRSLVQHVRDVADALALSLAEGRRSVARIVGRDTTEMDEPAVARAAVESAAENLSDGVIAPAFWFLIFGLPGILLYKAINTADSMIGHRTPRHEAFGWAAARLDDLLNLIPARLTAAMILAVAGQLSRWRAATRDARLHRSPNAGWPEAAMARVLDVALSGPRSYGGVPTSDPFVHPTGRRQTGPADIDRANTVLWRVWWLMLGAVAILAVV